MDIENWLRARIAASLEIGADAVDIHAPLTRFGIDSVEALTITVELEDLLQRRLSTTLVWDHPTIDQLVKHLQGDGTAPAPSAERALPEQNPREALDPSLYDIGRFDEYRDLRLNKRLAQVPSIGMPYFKLSTGVSNNVVAIGDREYANYSTYNYLGLSGHPRLLDAANAASRTYGTSSSASRLTAGEKPVHRALEKQIATLLQVDDAVCFVGGHATNVSFIGKFLGPDDLFLHDELAHDSMIQGAKLSGAARVPFRHNDAAGVESFLRERRRRYRRVLIAIEGVYSTDGDVPPVRDFVTAKRRHGALLMVDEAHSIGVLGRHGGGLREHAQIAGSDVDVWMGTLSKAFASCGGYIAGSRALVEIVKYTSPGFVFSVGMTPASAAVALEAIRVMLEEPERLQDLRERAAFFREHCQALGLDTGLSNDSAVVPVLVGDSLQCMRLAQMLFARGINVTPMVYPAVRNNKARLRFFVSSLHTLDQLRTTAELTAECLQSIRARYPGSFERLRETAVIEPANAAIAREGFEAFTKGDLSVLARQLDPHATYFYPGAGPLAGYHRGRDAVLDFFASSFELSDGTLSVEIEAILSDSRHAAIVWRNVVHRDGQRVAGVRCEILDVERETIVRATSYAGDPDGDDPTRGSLTDPWVQPEAALAGSPGVDPEAVPLRDAMSALIAGSGDLAAFATEGASVTVSPQLRAEGTAPVTMPLADLGGLLAAFGHAGATLAVDMALVGNDALAVRIVLRAVDGYLGTLCFFAECTAGKIERAWLASDVDARRARFASGQNRA